MSTTETPMHNGVDTATDIRHARSGALGRANIVCLSAQTRD
jgi:hypothetical protein